VNTGTLYGIGVGPGDPDLITLKAINVLSRVSTIFAASSTKNEYSLAFNIVSRHIKRDIPLVLLGFPMTLEKKELVSAWENNARKIIRLLRQGQDAAFITLGDPMTYSTFGYIMETVKKIDPDIQIRIIPGITSYQAGAAAAGMVLAEAEDTFTVISGALGAKNLKQVIKHSGNLVILKVYRNYREIVETLNDCDLASASVLVSRCGMDNEVVLRDLEKGLENPPPYLSLLLVRKKDRKRELKE